MTNAVRGLAAVSRLRLTDHQFPLLRRVDRFVWKEEANLAPGAYAKFGARLPQALWDQHEALIDRLEAVSIAAEL